MAPAMAPRVRLEANEEEDPVLEEDEGEEEEIE